jgi:cephalosporin hydroxylase
MTTNKRDLVMGALVLAIGALASILIMGLTTRLDENQDVLARIEASLTPPPAAPAPRTVPGPARATVPACDRQAAIEQLAPLYQNVLVAKPPTWLGAVTQQSPHDCWTMQEILYETKPDLIIEAGTSRGGLALFLASVLSLINPEGKIITLDVNPEAAIDMPVRAHSLYKKSIQFIQGNDLSPAILARLKKAAEGRKTFVMLDTLHDMEHVLKELRAYADLVSVGGYVVVHDTNWSGHPIGPPNAQGPWEAVQEFLRTDDRFQVDRTRERFIITLMPSGYLKRVK